MLRLRSLNGTTRKKTFTVAYKTGDIVLVNFPFTDLVSSKVRPAVVVTTQGEDVIILGIFSRIPETIQDSWVVIEDTAGYFSKTGLKKKSIIKTEKIAVIQNSIIKKNLGTLQEDIFGIVKEKLRKTLKLD